MLSARTSHDQNHSPIRLRWGYRDAPSAETADLWCTAAARVQGGAVHNETKGHRNTRYFTCGPGGRIGCPERRPWTCKKAFTLSFDYFDPTSSPVSYLLRRIEARLQSVVPWCPGPQPSGTALFLRQARAEVSTARDGQRLFPLPGYLIRGLTCPLCAGPDRQVSLRASGSAPVSAMRVRAPPTLTRKLAGEG